MTTTARPEIIFRQEVTVYHTVMVVEEDKDGGMYLNGEKVSPVEQGVRALTRKQGIASNDDLHYNLHPDSKGCL